MPQIVTGIRIGLGVGWMALVAAELVGANSGLGFLINDARTVLRTDFILDGMLSIGIIGLTIDRVIRYSAKKINAMVTCPKRLILAIESDYLNVSLKSRERQ